MRTSEVNKKKQREHNFWKWGFIGLIVVLLIGGGYLYHQITAPVEAPVSTSAPKKSDSSFEVDLNKKQINALAANYLTKLQKGQKVKYRFFVGENAIITGKTKFLGATINFALNFTPKKLANGNVLLKAKGLAVGHLNLPIKYVMGYVKNNYKIPNWVKLNQKKKTILLDLNKYSKHHSLHYSAEEINMQQGHFRFLVTIPKN